MESNNKKITETVILEAIDKQASIYKRKFELFEELQKINTELKTLEENAAFNSFGFKTDTDISNRSKSGFAQDSEFSNGLSYIKRLENEMNMIGDSKDELETLRKENELLKKQLEKNS